MSKKAKLAKYFKNLGKAPRDLFNDFLSSSSMIEFVNDVRDDIKDQKTNKVDLKSFKDAQKRGFFNWLNADRFEDGSYQDDLKQAFKDFLQGFKTGDFTKKEIDEFSDLLDDDFTFYDEDETNFEENYNIKGGNMNLLNSKNEMIRKLKIITTKESLDEVSPIESLNNRIIDIKNEIIRQDEYVDENIPTEINEVIIDNNLSDIKKRIIALIEAISSDITVEQSYKQILADSLAALFYVSSCNKLDNNCNKDTANSIKRDIDITINKIDNIGAVDTAKEVSDRLQNLNVEIDNQLETVELGNPNEVISAGENFSLGLLDLGAAFFAVPINTLNSKNIQKVQAKYGSNFVFKQPMVVSDSISNELSSKYSKALEVKELLELKGLIESTAAQMDGGSVIARSAKGSKVLSPLNIQLRNELSKVASSTDLSYEDIISAFSESGRDFLTYKSKLDTTVAESFIKVINRNQLDFDLINSLSEMTSFGESGEFIEHRRNALPSFMTVKIEYKDSTSPIKLDTTIRSRETTLGLQILPRKIDSKLIVDTLAEVNAKAFDKIAVTKDERNFIKKMRNIVSLWRKKGDKNDIKLLKSNEFADILNKINNVKTPLFHIVISFSEYVYLKNDKGIDLMNGSAYKNIMSRLPLISITIVDEDSDILYLSEGASMSYIKHSVDDFIDTVAQYEKELKTILKYNQI